MCVKGALTHRGGSSGVAPLQLTQRGDASINHKTVARYHGVSVLSTTELFQGGTKGPEMKTKAALLEKSLLFNAA